MKFFKKWKPTTFLMDENVRMGKEDFDKFPHNTIINTTDHFKKGTADEILTFWAKKEKWVVVTKDIKMALRSLIGGVPIIYISDEFKCISFLNVQVYDKSHYHEMYNYLFKRFDFGKA